MSLLKMALGRIQDRCVMGVYGDQCPQPAVAVVDDWPMCQEHAEIQTPLRNHK